MMPSLRGAVRRRTRSARHYEEPLGDEVISTKIAALPSVVRNDEVTVIAKERSDCGDLKEIASGFTLDVMVSSLFITGITMCQDGGFSTHSI